MNNSINRDPKKELEVFIVTAIAILLETEHYAKQQNQSKLQRCNNLRLGDAVERVLLLKGNIAFR